MRSAVEKALRDVAFDGLHPNVHDQAELLGHSCDEGNKCNSTQLLGLSNLADGKKNRGSDKAARRQVRRALQPIALRVGRARIGGMQGIGMARL